MTHAFLTPLPRIVAHRGDSKYYPENTLPAFISAAELGVDVIETDVHLTKDGKIVIWHDPTLDRNTNGTGTLESHTLEELKALDAGYTFTTDDGKSYPFRGKGIQLATLDEVLKALPEARFNIDLKSKDTEIVEHYIEVIRSNKAEDRVCTASFHLENLKRVRTLAPDLLTSITTVEVVPLVFRQKLHILPSAFKRKTIFQIPTKQCGIRIITPSFVNDMHKRDAIIMVWTINQKEDMKYLYSIGVDTIMTDDPRLLIETATEMGIKK
ncbi:MAG: glycerophosphodiester phosphodiesterase [Spirochaetes bacterium]|uniref:Glycerophosphodiester phosphodiesterase n=1 Tax=Candidatus Ornithospirochaeta stercoripullorum TaxID=2840899 RepID=A0A9D9H5H2_9SPIO|nr:glycerophosphodiester phosphodiesterase [Candidatus Ornithospirochaeta stercoripullorum]